MNDQQEKEREKNLAQQLHASEARRADAEKRISALQIALTNAIETRVLTEEECAALATAEHDNDHVVVALRDALKRIGIMPRKTVG